MKHPGKTWRGINGLLHHTIGLIVDSSTATTVIVSKTWRPRYKCWVFHATPLDEWVLLGDFRRQWAAQRKGKPRT